VLTSTPLVSFDVLGVPYPQGSKRAFMAGGKARMREASGLNHASWRNAVAEKARAMRNEVGPFDGPLGLTVAFRFPMPKTRTKAARTAGVHPKTAAPDLDKLVRTIGDALEASGLIVSDACICRIAATKVETTDWTGASITLTREDA
jgi:Holliday junction resolvase RusA-like endonuclease